MTNEAAPTPVLDDATEKLETCPSCGKAAAYHLIQRYPGACPGRIENASAEVIPCAA